MKRYNIFLVVFILMLLCISIPSTHAQEEKKGTPISPRSAESTADISESKLAPLERQAQQKVELAQEQFMASQAKMATAAGAKQDANIETRKGKII